MFLSGILFDIPDATTTLADIGSWSLPIFDEFKDLLWPFIGVAIVVMIFVAIMKVLKH
jgi:hypothetical protein